MSWSRPRAGAVPLRELTLKELDPYADGKARILLEGPAVSLTPRIALALGMVLHELATNASKYGALSVPQGHVTIAWSLEGATPQALRLRWSEVGGPAWSRRCTAASAPS